MASCVQILPHQRELHAPMGIATTKADKAWAGQDFREQLRCGFNNYLYSPIIDVYFDVFVFDGKQ